MSVSMGAPAVKPQDVKVLYSASGTQAAGGAGVINIGSFTLPAFDAGTRVFALIGIYRATGAENCGAAFSQANNDITGLCALNSATGSLWYKVEVFPDEENTDRVCYTYATQAAAVGVNNGSTALGDRSAAKTIYFNVQRQAASTFNYFAQFIMIKDGVK